MNYFGCHVVRGYSYHYFPGCFRYGNRILNCPGMNDYSVRSLPSFSPGSHLNFFDMCFCRYYGFVHSGHCFADFRCSGPGYVRHHHYDLCSCRSFCPGSQRSHENEKCWHRTCHGNQHWRESGKNLLRTYSGYCYLWLKVCKAQLLRYGLQMYPGGLHG